jgi:hypothetical protein
MFLTYGGQDVSTDNIGNIKINQNTNEVMDDTIQNTNSETKT